MRKAIFAIVTVGVALMVSGASATLVSEKDASICVENWLLSLSGSAFNTFDRKPVIEDFRRLDESGKSVAYIARFKPAGWAVVSGTLELGPIIAFSLDGVLPDRKIEGPLALVYNGVLNAEREFVSQYGSLANTPNEQLAENENRSVLAWEQLQSGAIDKIEEEIVGPLMGSEWGQGFPFNERCPVYAGTHAPAGCIAVAAAQIVNYYRVLESGSGVHFYFYNDPYDGTNSMYTAHYDDPYDWNLIRDSYNGYTPSQSEVDAISELIVEMAVGVEMMWGPTESAAYSEKVIHLLSEHMQFQPSMNYIKRSDSGSDEEWFNIIKSQIDDNSLVYYAMTLSGGGHAVVVDGYWQASNGQKLLSVNYGWDGLNNKMWLLNSIGIDQPSERAIVGIRPYGWRVKFEDTFAECVAWADFNNDEYPDIFVGDNDYYPGRLYENIGGETFELVWLPAVNIGQVEAASWGDYNNDGYADLLVGGVNSVVLYKNTGDGTFVAVTNLFVNDPDYCKSISWGDFNNDGLLDILVGGSPSIGGVHVYQNMGYSGFPNFQEFSTTTFDGVYASSANCGDFDGDGVLDISVVSLSHDSLALFEGQGNGDFIDRTSAVVEDVGGMTVSWGDVDNDSDLDAFVAGGGYGNVLLENLGSWNFQENTPTGLVLSSVVTSSGVFGDYNNDGDLDIYLTNSSIWGTEFENMLFQNTADGAFVRDTLWGGGVEGNGASNAAAWADYDQDGDIDLFADGGPVGGPRSRLFENDLHQETPGLTVKLKGTVSNWSGIGSRISVTVGEEIFNREIEGSSTGACQSALQQCIRVGESGYYDSIRIDWSTGGTTVRPRGNVASPLFIEEISVSGVDVTDLRSELAEPEAWPNPFNPNVRIAFVVEKPGPVSVSIYNVRGGIERTLVNEYFESGRYTTSWNGQNSEGRPVGSGIYFLKVQSPTSVKSLKLNLVK